jgi:hypothetical protein
MEEKAMVKTNTSLLYKGKLTRNPFNAWKQSKDLTEKHKPTSVFVHVEFRSTHARIRVFFGRAKHHVLKTHCEHVKVFDVLARLPIQPETVVRFNYKWGHLINGSFVETPIHISTRKSWTRGKDCRQFA